LQRELAVARQIHAGMRGDSREVVLPAQPDATQQGPKMALRVGVAFIVLMGVNVAFGLWLIVRHETRNPNHALLEKQMREQITKSIESAGPLTPGPNPLGVSEITISAAQGKLETVADEVVRTAARLGGSATKGLEDSGRIRILVDVPSNQETEFRAAIGEQRPQSTPAATATVSLESQQPSSAHLATAEKKSFVVQIVEEPTKAH
jgi:hypothetical protein